MTESNSSLVYFITYPYALDYKPYDKEKFSKSVSWYISTNFNTNEFPYLIRTNLTSSALLGWINTQE